MTPEREEKVQALIEGKQAGLTLIIEDVTDPHNTAAILRSADAFGVPVVHVVNTKEAHVNLKEVGHIASSSANKWVRVEYHNSIDTCIKQLHEEGYTIVATTLAEDSQDIYDLSFDSPTAFIIGNEHRGISKEAASLADIRMSIPMRGMIQSLNVSVAAAICLAEATRQRIATNTLLPLSEKSKSALYEYYTT